AGLPVMEGKAALMAQLANLSGVPILIEGTDPKRIIEAVVAIAPSFGAIQLEDIAGPECFEIEEALVERLPIPVLHDDQHGTAVVTLAALLVATARIGKDLGDCVVGQIGLGAAGIGIARLLTRFGVRRMLGSDLREDALVRLDHYGGERASLEELMQQSDVVVATTGRRGLIKPEMVQRGQIILALSNPDAEIEPMLATNAGAAFAADGQSVNNLLGYPGLFRGAIDAGAKRFTDAMLIAAARAIATLTPNDMLVPDPLDPMVHRAVAAAVAAAVREA
ncbi:MAG: malate dehydrogenase (oxaloacetate-decarboxylating), partial [Flavobacteriales bacterium]